MMVTSTRSKADRDRMKKAGKCVNTPTPDHCLYCGSGWNESKYRSGTCGNCGAGALFAPRSACKSFWFWFSHDWRFANAMGYYEIGRRFLGRETIRYYVIPRGDLRF